MTITEPATLTTDYLLAAFTAVLAWRLLRAARANRSQWWWAVAFATTAVVGITGGTVHRFQLVLPPLVRDALWLVTIEGLIVAAFAVVRGTLVGSQLRDSARRGATWIAVTVYTAYGVWVSANPRFVFAIAGYGVALVVLVVLKRWRGAGIAEPRAGCWRVLRFRQSRPSCSRADGRCTNTLTTTTCITSFRESPSGFCTAARTRQSAA